MGRAKFLILSLNVIPYSKFTYVLGGLRRLLLAVLM